jgi:hypothetical protein
MSKALQELNRIQRALKVPKGQFNSFGNYKYRSTEDILEAIKPLLGTSVITLSDELVSILTRVYVKATAMLVAEDESVVITHAFAREEETKKGMDASQITGSSSSYARKYALNGLLCNDDTKDADATNTHGKEDEPVVTTKGKKLTPKQQEAIEAPIVKTVLEEFPGAVVTEVKVEGEAKAVILNKITGEQIVEINNLLKEAGLQQDRINKICAYYKVESIADLSTNDYPKLIQQLNMIINKNKKEIK